LPAAGYNQRLDGQIESYLTLLSPLFMIQPAHKTMEYLVRRYRWVQCGIACLCLVLTDAHG
jgi:hypothetical protein